ncbi:MBL fold metallo-hydrolase [Corallococcus aberystwythensis]|nr:MBL fold metallo-hydrolase [Corallococcus aberystwythensis]
MQLPRELFVNLVSLSSTSHVPLDGLLVGMLRAELSPEAVRALLASTRERLGNALLRPEGVDDGGWLVEEQVLYPSRLPWRMTLVRGASRRWVEVPPGVMPLVAHFLRQVAHEPDARRVQALWPFDDASWELWRDVTPTAPSRWSVPDGPGIYRREHASLLIRSRTTSILVDPLGLHRRMPSMTAAPTELPPEDLGAVVITHGHGDHWHLPSLLAQVASARTPVIVPRVSRVSLLTPMDFVESLEACGQSALAPAWGDTVRIGDIDIDVLPFHGEQPSREGPPLDGHLRNWGNCYRFTTEDFSCLLLVDGGADPWGDMEDVLAASCARRGPVDVLLACQREFKAPFFGGLGSYWAALPWGRLQALYRDHQQGTLGSVTAGASGAVKLCERAQARYFLPYANGFERPGQPITDIGWGLGEPSEADRNAFMRDALARQSLSTQVLDWCPGDVARFERGALTLTPGRQGAPK